MERIEKRIGNTTIIIDLNISVREDKPKYTIKNGEFVQVKKGKVSPMKGKHYKRQTCHLCGKDIGANAFGRHMKRVHNVSK